MSNRDEKTSENCADYFLDISNEVCPLTFVRTKLLLERMAPGEMADVLLRGAEPLANVPNAVASQGHTIVELVPLAADHVDPAIPASAGVHRLRVRKMLPPHRIRGRDS
ncbi:MAG: sulfurtransferase TusA family protein [Rhodospirillales bacterium]|nr:sulfurtransferase TusA family protein [Rhodospirillales bacterium]